VTTSGSRTSARTAAGLWVTGGVLRCWASDTDVETVDPRFGKVGKQRIEDTGPLTRKRMETVDEEFIDAGTEFMKRAQTYECQTKLPWGSIWTDVWPLERNSGEHSNNGVAD
jgi:hypothetical protein